MYSSSTSKNDVYPNCMIQRKIGANKSDGGVGGEPPLYIWQWQTHTVASYPRVFLTFRSHLPTVIEDSGNLFLKVFFRREASKMKVNWYGGLKRGCLLVIKIVHLWQSSTLNCLDIAGVWKKRHCTFLKFSFDMKISSTCQGKHWFSGDLLERVEQPIGPVPSLLGHPLPRVSSYSPFPRYRLNLSDHNFREVCKKSGK